MEKKAFENIFDTTKSEWTGDNCIQGLLIINKYITDKTIVCGAGHDIVHSVSVDDILKAGITEEDAVALRKLNWMISEFDNLACFV